MPKEFWAIFSILMVILLQIVEQINVLKRVQYLLQEGKVSLDVVMEIFGNTGRKKSRTANKAEVNDFN